MNPVSASGHEGRKHLTQLSVIILRWSAVSFKKKKKSFWQMSKQMMSFSFSKAVMTFDDGKCFSCRKQQKNGVSSAGSVILQRPFCTTVQCSKPQSAHVTSGSRHGPVLSNLQHSLWLIFTCH